MEKTVVFQFQHINIFNYANMKLLLNEQIAGSATFNLSGELAVQETGPSLYATEVELNKFTSEASIMFKNYDSELLEILMGATTNSTTPTGGAVVQENARGSDIFEDEFIMSIAIGTTPASDLKDGLYRVEVDSTTDQVVLTRLSGNNYVGEESQTLTLSSSATIATNFGFSFGTGASYDFSTVNEGDYGTFRIIAAGAEHSESIIGMPSSRIPKVKLEVTGRELSDGRLFSLYIPNAIFPGLNLTFGPEFAENEVSGSIIYDPIEECIARINRFRKD